MTFDDSERACEVADRVRAFVDDEVIPVERAVLGSGPVSDDQLAYLRSAAREAGVYAPQVPEAYGGLGLDFRETLPVFEAAGRSLLGPPAIRADAPDEGNMHLLELAGTDDQLDRWLAPLAAGELSSAFAMTEPIQGGGSDPTMLRTTAERDGGQWVVDGHKWWTTGGVEADLLFVMARTDPDVHPYEGTSILAVPADADGVHIRRAIPHVGGNVTGQSHAEILFRDVRVPSENVIGAVDDGFALAQRRLGPARLTHCMRATGMADRALSIAVAYTSEREAFGSTLSEKGALRHRIADAHTRLYAARSMVRQAASTIAAGDRARVPVSMCKVFAVGAVQDAVDLAVQCCGANGIGKDLPLADFYENVRALRIVDGADEVHRRTIAREAFDDPPAWELDPITRYDGE